MNGLTIHQIYYREDQRPHLDPCMKHWDNRENLRPEWCELWVMRTAAQRFDDHFDERTGFFSWKYRQKLQLEYSQIEGFVQAHPEADCHIFSPAVFQVAFYRNVWAQAEAWHPGMTAVAQTLLDALEIRIDLAATVDHHLTTAFANYWVATRPVWKAYLAFMDRVFTFIDAQRDDPQSPFWKHLYGSAGGSGHVQRLPVIPYLVERLFSVFVKQHPEFKIAAWEYPFHVLQQRAYRAAGLIPLANWCKLMYLQTSQDIYLTLFAHVQQRMIEAVNLSLQENPGAVIC